MFGRGGGKKRARIEPRLDWPGERGDDDLRADPADSPPTVRRNASARRGSRPKRSRRRPLRTLFGQLAYWGAVVGVWAVVAIAGLVVYEASRLPPIDQLAVPKRPPNIAILAEDGTLLVNRGDWGGPRCGSTSCRPTSPRPSSPSRTAVSIPMPASTRSAWRARSFATSLGAARSKAARPSPSSSPRTCS